MTYHDIQELKAQYIDLIENYHAGIDPEFDHGFDPVLDDLEREFAALRFMKPE